MGWTSIRFKANANGRSVEFTAHLLEEESEFRDLVFSYVDTGRNGNKHDEARFGYSDTILYVPVGTKPIVPYGIDKLSLTREQSLLISTPQEFMLGKLDKQLRIPTKGRIATFYSREIILPITLLFHTFGSDRTAFRGIAEGSLITVGEGALPNTDIGKSSFQVN